MLRGHKSPGTLAAEIKMLRTSHGGAFLILEGKDDIRFWRPRRHATCDLIDGEGNRTSSAPFDGSKPHVSPALSE